MNRLVLFILLAGMLAGCAGETAVTSGTPIPTKTVTPSPTPTKTLIPSYTPVTCSKSSFPTGTFNAEDGFYQFVLNDDCSFTFLEAGEIVARGTYSIHANEFTFETDNFCGSTKGTYTWTFADDTLLFKMKGFDGCPARAYSIRNIPYHEEE